MRKYTPLLSQAPPKNPTQPNQPYDAETDDSLLPSILLLKRYSSDTLYLCYAIDHASNDEHCPKAAEAFTAKPTDISDSILPF